MGIFCKSPIFYTSLTFRELREFRVDFLLAPGACERQVRNRSCTRLFPDESSKNSKSSKSSTNSEQLIFEQPTHMLGAFSWKVLHRKLDFADPPRLLALLSRSKLENSQKNGSLENFGGSWSFRSNVRISRQTFKIRPDVNSQKTGHSKIQVAPPK